MINNDDVWREAFVNGLKNAHAVEHQALALMDRQIDRAKNFLERRTGSKPSSRFHGLSKSSRAWTRARRG